MTSPPLAGVLRYVRHLVRPEAWEGLAHQDNGTGERPRRDVKLVIAAGQDEGPG
jgi:hypothetical protein